MSIYNGKLTGALIDALPDSIANKVDKIEGKGLSTNDFTDELKAKLTSLDERVSALVDGTEEEY